MSPDRKRWISSERRCLTNCSNQSRRNKVGLKGPITTPVGKGFTSVNVGLRKALDLYANLRPIRALPNVPCRNPELNLVVVRENTESLYSGLEHEIIPGVVESLKIITEKASTRIAKFAFDFARDEKRKKITCTHKANIMKMSDGLFLKCFRTVAQEYPEIESADMIIDNAAMQLVMRPEQFDILLCENLYGDIVSDLCAGLIGGLGLVPGANIGEKGAVFEAVHGSAPDIAGKGIANPDGVAAIGDSDAASHRRTRRRRQNRTRDADGFRRRQSAHARHRRFSQHERVCRCDHREDEVVPRDCVTSQSSVVRQAFAATSQSKCLNNALPA